MFDKVIANSVNQIMHYEKLKLLSKWILKIDIQLHIKVGFPIVSLINFCKI